MDETWEARMAARTADRARLDYDVVQEHIDRAYRAEFADRERQGMEWRAGMTLGHAMQLRRAEPWACACVGPPHCCRFDFLQAEALHRGAHIVAKLLADVGATP